MVRLIGNIIDAFETGLRLVAAPLLVIAVVDGVILLRAGRLDAAGAFTICACAAAAAAGIAVLIVPLVAFTRWTRRPEKIRALGPNHPVVLLTLAGAGAGFVWVNRQTFTGDRFRTMPFASVIEAGITVVATVAILGFSVLQLRALMARDRNRMPWAWIGLLLAATGGVAYVDRTFQVGQYPQIHLQLLAVCVITAACAGAFLPAPRSPVRGVLTIAILLFAAAGIGAPRLSTAATWVGRLAKAQHLQSQRLVELLTPAHRFVDPGNRVREVDVSRFFTTPVHDRAAVEAALASRFGDTRLNLVVLSLDTVRADHVNFLGYEKNPTTPNWDRIAGESFVFENAYTGYPTSNYAYSGLWSSTYAHECPQRQRDMPWPEDFALASVLKRAGFITSAVTAFQEKHTLPDAPFETFREGFDEFITLGEASREASARPIADAAIAKLEKFAATPDRPFFLWLQFFDPHSLYVKRDGFDFGDTTSDRYDSEIAFCDSMLARLDAALTETGLADRTVFVIHSDHGEGLGDHDSQHHHSSVFEEQIHVPLTVRVPKTTGSRITETTSLIDVLPTTLGLLRVPDSFSTRRRGRDLTPLLLGLRKDGASPTFALSQLLLTFFPSGERHAVIMDGRKVVWIPRGFPEWESYNLASDAGETDPSVDDEDAEATMKNILLHILKDIDR